MHPKLRTLTTAALCAMAAPAILCAADLSGGPDLWTLAGRHADTLRFSTLFTAQDVGRGLVKPGATEKAIEWCRETAVTHVYIESFRDGYTVEKDVLLAARKAFIDAGFAVSGCITPTGIGRKSVNGWLFPCFSEAKGREKLRTVCAFTAGIFDEIMIDDFFATDCQCDDCKSQRGSRSWSEYRLELLADVSRRDMLEPARAANPNVKVIIKYPQWYDRFHERGYDVAVQPEMFDKIWVGTETREPDSGEWGRKTQYEAYFIMRWLGAIGGAKCGGGWFDPYGTRPHTYVEQARQTILGGAKEALLFCYGSLQNETGPENITALRAEIPALFELARLIKDQPPRGIIAPKPPNSPPGANEYIYDFIGMLGLPLVPTAVVPDQARAVFLPFQAAADPGLSAKLDKLAGAGTPLLLTRQLADRLGDRAPAGGNVQVLDVPKDAWELMQLPRERLDGLRAALLAPWGVEFKAPSRVALYLLGEKLAVVENFNDEPVEATLAIRGAAPSEVILSIPAREPGDVPAASPTLRIPKRSLVVVRFGN